MLRFLEWEKGIFFHFGIRTFNEERRDWDYVDMPIDTFNPRELDCRQWAKAVKDAGFTYAVMTTKHHDGFCMWQTEYSDYSLKNCAWRDGKGDVVKEYLEAMREYDIKTGLYYSPADQIVFNQELSEEDHNALIRNHIRELCRNYGEIDYLWFDNCGSEKCRYDWDRVMTGCIRPTQPNTIVNSNGDTQSCWIGNEAGYAPEPCKYIHDLEAYGGEERVSKKLLDEAEDGKFWSPTECDFMLDERSWFYNSKRKNKSLEVLMGIYYYSVGRGVNLLMNVAPDQRGLIPDDDVARLQEYGCEIRTRFADPVAKLADFEREENTFVLKFEGPKEITQVVLKEDIAEGHKVRKFNITAQPYLHSKEKIQLFQSTGIGHKAICQFPIIYLQELYIEIEEAEGEFNITDIEVL